MKIDTSVRTYTDSRGVTHEFRFTVGLMRQLAKPPLSVDLLDLDNGGPYRLNVSDTLFLSAVAVVLGINEDATLFDELDGERLAQLRSAFWGGFGFFTQSANPAKWDLVRKLMEQTEKVAEEAIMRKINSLSGSPSSKPLDT